ncbi:MAG TPA: hypothetical protein ENJ20_01310, partial [Bacteroidetes bacterium]|nr:hypothetical protein [Bacteroidota bacterium]
MMKNYLIGMAAFFMLSIHLQAQDYGKQVRYFKKGQTDIQLGFGLLNAAAIMDGASAKMPALNIKGDRFFSDNFSLGVGYHFFSHESQPYLIPDGIVQRLTNTTHQLTLRPAFHITGLKSTDFYGGILLGLAFESFSVDKGGFDYQYQHQNLRPKQTKGIYGGFVGARYILTRHFCIF